MKNSAGVACWSDLVNADQAHAMLCDAMVGDGDSTRFLVGSDAMGCHVMRCQAMILGDAILRDGFARRCQTMR